MSYKHLLRQNEICLGKIANMLIISELYFCLGKINTTKLLLRQNGFYPLLIIKHLQDFA